MKNYNDTFEQTISFRSKPSKQKETGYKIIIFAFATGYQMGAYSQMTSDSAQEEICLRDISYNQAKSEIAEFFSLHHGQEINPADIQEKLGIDIWMAIDICDELQNEGRIREL